MITIRAELEVDRPAAQAWAIVADYGRDAEWRAAVQTMRPQPPGVVRVGTTTDERMRFAGRSYRNGGVVGLVGPGLRFVWRTTSGVDADGSRSVEELDGGRCRVRLETRVRPSGAERLLAPLMRIMLQRGLEGDLGRLRALAERAGEPAQSP